MLLPFAWGSNQVALRRAGQGLAFILPLLSFLPWCWWVVLVWRAIHPVASWGKQADGHRCPKQQLIVCLLGNMVNDSAEASHFLQPKDQAHPGLEIVIPWRGRGGSLSSAIGWGDGSVGRGNRLPHPWPGPTFWILQTM